MSLLVAGADAVVARCEPLLQALSNKVFRISERPGDGARTKLVNNLLAGINLVGAAEALAGFPELLNRFLQLSRQINASGGNFNADTEFARALAAELLAMRDLITGRAPLRVLKDTARQRGFISLREAGLALVRDGLTTLQELNRVTFVA